MPDLYCYSVTNSPWLRNNCKFNFAISRLAPLLPSSPHCLSVCLSVSQSHPAHPSDFFPGAHKNLLPNLSLSLGLGLFVRGINFQINWQNALRPWRGLRSIAKLAASSVASCTQHFSPHETRNWFDWVVTLCLLESSRDCANWFVLQLLWIIWESQAISYGGFYIGLTRHKAS